MKAMILKIVSLIFLISNNAFRQQNFPEITLLESEKISKDLNLNDHKINFTTELYLSYAYINEKIKLDESLNEDQKNEKIKLNENNKYNKFFEILTSDQKQKIQFKKEDKIND